jgi:hypothetical protein
MSEAACALLSRDDDCLSGPKPSAIPDPWWMMRLDLTTPCLQSQIGQDLHLRGSATAQAEAALDCPWLSARNRAEPL